METITLKYEGHIEVDAKPVFTRLVGTKYFFNEVYELNDSSLESDYVVGETYEVSLEIINKI